MAISRKKQEAINNVYAMEQKVAQYRGIPDFRYDWKDYSKNAIWVLENFVKSMEKLLNEEIPMPSEKQINYLNILLSKDYINNIKEEYNKAINEGKSLNKYQATLLISKLKLNDEYIYGNYPNIGQRDFAELEECILSIISMMK